MVTMRLPAEVIAQLDRIAAAEETSRSEVIRTLIEAGLKRKRS
jgi:metal-responsive CopG/Arc/MetJ family transcriptional regulator